jgi:hypothetical protein
MRLPNIFSLPLAHELQGRTRVCAQPEGGHMGPPLQKINYLYDRSLV